MKVAVSTLLLLALPLFVVALTTPPANANASANATAQPLCAFNSFGLVPGNKRHTYSLLNAKTANFTETDFNVTWQDKRIKNHRFFAAIGRSA